MTLSTELSDEVLICQGASNKEYSTTDARRGLGFSLAGSPPSCLHHAENCSRSLQCSRQRRASKCQYEVLEKGSRGPSAYSERS